MTSEQLQATEDGILFTVSVDKTSQQCVISREALNKLSQLKNIDTADANMMEIFMAFETYIRPVAQDLVKVRKGTETIRLTSQCIAAAYDYTVKH